MSTPPLFTPKATQVRARRPRPATLPVLSAQVGEGSVCEPPGAPESPPQESRPQLHLDPLGPESPRNANVRPTVPASNSGCDVRLSAGRSLRSMGGLARTAPEHSLMILRMGHTQYLQRCLTDGLTWRGASPASEYTALGWAFSRSSTNKSDDQCTIPLPTFPPGDIPLCLYGARGPRPVVSDHITITDCRVYYAPVPAIAPLRLPGFVAHYAVPMSILDEMERCIVGYNTFVHRLESPCFSGYSNLAVQMDSSPLILQSECPSAASEVEVDDWLGVQLEATHYSYTTLCCVPYLSPYTHVEGSLCKDTTCVSSLDLPDYRPITSSGVATAVQVLVPRLRVLCVAGQNLNQDQV